MMRSPLRYHASRRLPARTGNDGPRKRSLSGSARLGLMVLAGTAVFTMFPYDAPSREPVQSGVLLYYGPSSELAQVDQKLLGKAQKTIDMAAYILSDRGIISALREAAERGVHIRLYLDGDEMAQARQSDSFDALSVTKNVTIKFKALKSETMHLKSYVVDGRHLRTGSTNFTHSGETAQDNDIMVTENNGLAGSFLKNFEILWSRTDNIDLSRSMH